MKNLNFATIVARVMVMACALFCVVSFTSCEKDDFYKEMNGQGNGNDPQPTDPTLSDVIGDGCKLVKSNDENVSSVNGVTTVSKAYDFEKSFELVYSDQSTKEQVEEYIVEHTFVLSGLNNVFSVSEISEIEGKSFNVVDGKAEIAGRQVSVTASKKANKEVNFSNGHSKWNYSIENTAEKWEDDTFKGQLCSNNLIGMTISFGSAQKVEGTDNTYNLTGSFVAEVTEGDNASYTFSAVATTSEKDEVYYSIENVHFVGNTIVFDGVEGHTLHPELNKRETLSQNFNASLRAGETISYNDLNSVSVANQNGNVFRYVQGVVTLAATYPSEVVVEYKGVTLPVSVPAPAFAEVNRNEKASEDENYKYLSTDITYTMSWGEKVAASATQSFVGRVEKEKDAVVRIYLDYTENNGVINGKLIEEHTLNPDVTLLSFSANRELSVKAEDLISFEAENNILQKTSQNNGSWERVSSYAGNNVKGDKMNAAFTYVYNGNVNNQVVISMNRNLYVEYAGVKYEIANVDATLSALTPVQGNTNEDSKYFLYDWTVQYVANASGASATATQDFIVKVAKPESTFPGWEVDEAYASVFSVTYSWNQARTSYDTFYGLIFRNISDHSQKKMVVFKEGQTTAFREVNTTEAEVNNFFEANPNRFLSVSYGNDELSEIAYLYGDFSKKDNSYKNGFGYISFGSRINVSFSPTTISYNNLPEPLRGHIVKNERGLWGGLWY